MRNLLLSILFLIVSPTFAHVLSEQQPHAYTCELCDYLSHESITTNWLEPSVNITKSEPLHAQSSKKYRLKVSLADLQKGVAINTLGTGAVIRIVPQQKGDTPAFTISKKDWHMPLKQASSLYAGDDALDDTFFAKEKVTVLKLKDELGQGKFILSTDATGKHTQQFVIHVYDVDSNLSLQVQTNKQHYQYGDELQVSIHLNDADASIGIENLQAQLSAPDGRSIPLQLVMVDHNTFRAKTTLMDEANPDGGNYYVEVQSNSTLNNETVKREAHTAFSYAVPSAVIHTISQENKGFTAEIEAATASRYAFQVVLFATDTKGRKVAIERLQYGNWLREGNNVIDFQFNEANLKKYRPPYYLGEISLLDYGQMKPVFTYNTPLYIELRQTT